MKQESLKLTDASAQKEKKLEEAVTDSQLLQRKEQRSLEEEDTKQESLKLTDASAQKEKKLEEAVTDSQLLQRKEQKSLEEEDTK